MGGPGGAPGMGGPGGAVGAAPVATPVAQVPPLETSRSNPFLPREAGAGTPGQPGKVLLVTSYGANWAQLPITARLGFVRPGVPPSVTPAPPAPSEEPAMDMVVTSILWTQDGQALAVYESGPRDKRKSGVVRPGDIVDDWQVLEIWRDRVVVADRKTSKQRTVYMTAKKPAAARAPGGGPSAPRAGGRRPRGGGGAPPVVQP